MHVHDVIIPLQHLGACASRFHGRRKSNTGKCQRISRPITHGIVCELIPLANSVVGGRYGRGRVVCWWAGSVVGSRHNFGHIQEKTYCGAEFLIIMREPRAYGRLTHDDEYYSEDVLVTSKAIGRLTTYI